MSVVLRPISAAEIGYAVLEKAGFTCTGEADDEHEGVPIKVKRWELVLSSA